MPIIGRADRQNSGITAHTPRSNTAETNGRNGNLGNKEPNNFLVMSEQPISLDMFLDILK
ncbi:MAG: hypothetical protein NTY92_05750 [Nitrosospira sp.]|nr:hypothetical protein [Nitrosospira sp.]